MTSSEHCCVVCGFASAGPGCAYCAGSVRSLDARRTWRPVPDRWSALFVGLGEVWRAVAALLHARVFVGALRVPVAANVVAFGSFVLFTWLVLAPAAAAAFAGPWPVLDDWRAAVAGHAPARWLLAAWLLLGPPWLDLVAGGLQEPLRAATERSMLGMPWAPPRTGSGVLRLRDRARVAAVVLLALPPCLLLVLVPWLGVPAVVLAGAAVAAVVWFEAPMARRALPLSARLALLRRHPWRCLGTGLGIQVAALVPFVNLLALAPAATVAATASYLQLPCKQLPRAASGLQRERQP